MERGLFVMKKVQLYNRQFKEEYLSSLRSADMVRSDQRFFGYMLNYEAKLDKDVKDFSVSEILDAFIGVPLVTAQQYKLGKVSLNRYRNYLRLGEIKLPSNVEIKQAYIEHGVPQYVLDDKDLYDTIMQTARHSGYDFEFHEMYIALLFMLYYGLSEQECMVLPETFVEDFRLPNGITITNPDIQQFFIDLSKSRGYHIADGRQMEYVNSPYLLRLAFYEGRLPKSARKSEGEENCSVVDILKVKSKYFTQYTSKLTIPNIALAGQMNRAFEDDLRKHDFGVILHYPELQRKYKNGTTNHGMSIVNEEKYQLFKAFRLKNNL